MTRITQILKTLASSLLLFVVLFGLYRGCRAVFPSAPEIYKIGIDSTWYPVSLYGKEPSLTAFSIDLMFAIAKDSRIKIEIVRSGPKRLTELLDDGIVDGILTPIMTDPNHENKYYFSDPYYRFGSVIIVRKEDNIEGLEGLKNKSLGIKRGSPVLYRIPLDSSVQIVPYESPLGAFAELSRRRLDAVIIDSLLAYLYFEGAFPGKFKITSLPLTPEGLRLMTLQEPYAEKWIESFNESLTRLKEEGVYDRLLIQWNLFNPEKLSP